VNNRENSPKNVMKRKTQKLLYNLIEQKRKQEQCKVILTAFWAFILTPFSSNIDIMSNEPCFTAKCKAEFLFESVYDIYDPLSNIKLIHLV